MRLLRHPRAGRFPDVTASGQKKDQDLPGAGRFAMALFLLSLAVLFAAGIIGYLVIRLRAPAWPPPGAPPLPGSLWLSTALIAAASVTVEAALRAVRGHRPAAFRRMAAAGLVVGVLFLVAQLASWLQLLGRGAAADSSLYAYTFFVLTAVHALHVTGGLAALGWVTRGAFRGRYTPFDHDEVAFTVLYWHFLGVIWLILFGVLSL